MINKFLPLLLFSVLFTACNSTIKEPLVLEIDQSTLTECETAACPQVSVQYITYNGKPKKVQAINDSINHFIIGSLYLGDPAAKPIAKTPKEAIQGFIKNYWRDTSEFPEINEYEAEVSISESFRSKEILTLTMSQYSYIGGAHGYATVAYKNFDIKTGNVITNKQLIKDLDAVTALAENKLREDYKLPKSDQINSSIFWFEDDTFYLSNAVGIENEKLVIHYNPYDIASYADGSIDIELPLKEVAPFLNFSLEK